MRKLFWFFTLIGAFSFTNLWAAIVEGKAERHSKEKCRYEVTTDRTGAIPLHPDTQVLVPSGPSQLKIF